MSGKLCLAGGSWVLVDRNPAEACWQGGGTAAAFSVALVYEQFELPVSHIQAHAFASVPSTLRRAEGRGPKAKCLRSMRLQH